jgi:uncharacterized protein YndB with AHSA1/START domain
VREIHGSAEAHVAANAASVFAVVTDVDELPRWNAAIDAVIDAPGQVVPGAEWTVRMRPNRMVHWLSVSTAETVNRDDLTFAYRTVNADGNPSYAVWRWQITPCEVGSDVCVTWDVYLKTWDRRHLAGPIRRRQLRKEVAGSLDRLAQRTAPPPS